MKRTSRDQEGSLTDSSSGRKKKSSQRHCDYCRRDISCTVHVECAVCSDFKLCLECFAAGVEILNHENSHSYKVIEYVTKEIFEESWGAHEELALLEGIQTYGFGNWSKISEHLGTKSKAKCEAHYNTIYLQSSNAPLPDMDKGIIMPHKGLKDSSEGNESLNLEKKLGSEGSKVKEKDKLIGLGNMIGYQPHRGDFDCEYENDAEQIIADLEFTQYDSEQEKLLKSKVLEIYNNKLLERIKRKKFILERNLLTQRNKRSKEEKETVSAVKAFARFHTAEEHEEFIKAEGELYDADLKRRDAVGDSNKIRNIELSTSSLSLTQSDNDSNDLLSVAEKNLCFELDILPKQYLEIKEAILKYAMANNLVNTKKFKDLIRIDINKTDKIIDFFVSSGWMKTKFENN